MKQRIVFRADGGQQIGLGHIMRSLSLAGYLKDEFACSFATTNTETQILQVIRQTCQKIIPLPGNGDHFNDFLKQLKGNDIVVLDNYFFSTENQEQIKIKGCALVCIDDKQDKHFVADVVINHAEGVNKENYSVESYSKLLLGFKYALVKPEFINKDSQKVNTEVRNVLVCIGGADPFNISKKVVDALSGQPKLQIHLILGAAYKYSESLEESAGYEKLKVYRNLSSSLIAELMKNSEFGIFPASTVAIEACAAGLPFATGYFVENQIQIYKGLTENDLAFDLGSLANISEEELEFKLTSFIQNKKQANQIRKHQKAMLDGNMKDRYLTVFKELAQVCTP